MRVIVVVPLGSPFERGVLSISFCFCVFLVVAGLGYEVTWKRGRR